MRVKYILILLIIHILVIPGLTKESKGYSIYGGTVYPRTWDGGFTFGASIKLSQISNQSLLATQVYYWTADQENSNLSLENLALSVEILYFLSHIEESFYIGVGLSLNNLSWQKLYSDSDSDISEVKVNEFDTRIGFVPRFGYILKVKILSPFLELRYHFIDSFNTFQAIGGVYIQID